MFVGRQHLVQFAAQLVVSSASVGQETRAGLRIEPGSRLKDLRHPAVPLGRHEQLSSLWSQALAARQSSMTVSAETLSTSAVSSTLNPPKKRNSTTRLCRE